MINLEDIKTVDPTRYPPDTTFVLEVPQRLSPEQREHISAWWKSTHNPLNKYRVMVLDSGVKLTAFAPRSPDA